MGYTPQETRQHSLYFLHKAFPLLCLPHGKSFSMTAPAAAAGTAQPALLRASGQHRAPNPAQGVWHRGGVSSWPPGRGDSHGIAPRDSPSALCPGQEKHLFNVPYLGFPLLGCTSAFLLEAAVVNNTKPDHKWH